MTSAGSAIRSGSRAIALVAVPVIVPMLGVVALQVPIKDLLLKILKILA